MMYIKVLLELFILATLASAQKSIASVDQQLSKIESSLDSRESTLRDSLVQLQAKVDVAIASTSSATNVRVELEKLKTLLADLVTVATFKTRNSSLSCNNLAEVTSKVFFTIRDSSLINVDVVANRTKLAVVFASLNTQYVIWFYRLSEQQQQDVKTVITHIYVVIDVKF